MYIYSLHIVVQQLVICTYICILYTLVSGDANFSITQPSVARHVVELPSSIEKGFTHRFMWIFPKPLYQKFTNLGKASQDFTVSLSIIVASCLLCTLGILYTKLGNATLRNYAIVNLKRGLVDTGSLRVFDKALSRVYNKSREGECQTLYGR